jgi:hypothetical protein
MSKHHLMCALLVAASTAACVDGSIEDDGADDGRDEPVAPGEPDSAVAAPPTTRCLNADGTGGVETYALIQSVLGNGAVESPDGDHAPAKRHVLEATDSDVGDHFVFLAHRDIDLDGDNTDRSRMEIKVAPSSGSHSALKAHDGDTFTYTWRFKIDSGVKFSNRFTHMFQLKSYQGDAGSPLITLTGRKQGSSSKLEVIHNGSPTLGKIASANLGPLIGKWLSVTVVARFSHHGEISITVRKPDGTTALSVTRSDIDLWRDGDHIRPKWGIYRGLSDQLRAEEDKVRFANFAITPSATPTSDCH